MIFSGTYRYTAYQNVSFEGFTHLRSASLSQSGFCYLNLLRTETGHIAIVTELYDNPAMSVDNAAGFIAEKLLLDFPEIEHETLTFVTRWSDKESYNLDYPGSDKERLALALFPWEKHNGSWSARNPQFSHTTRALLGLE